MGCAKLPGVPGADGGEVVLYLGMGESRARVLHRKDVASWVAADRHLRVEVSIGLESAPNTRIVGILDEFTKRDGRRGVQVLAQNLEQTAEIDLGSTKLGVFRHRGGESAVMLLVSTHTVVSPGMRVRRSPNPRPHRVARFVPRPTFATPATCSGAGVARTARVSLVDPLIPTKDARTGLAPRLHISPQSR